MTSAYELINDAAELAGAKAVGQEVSGDHAPRYLRALNRMLHSWRDDGVDLGFFDAELTDEIHIDSASFQAVVYNLAVLIYELEGRPFNQAVYLRAGKLFDDMKAKEIYFKEAELPRALTRRQGFNINEG